MIILAAGQGVELPKAVDTPVDGRPVAALRVIVLRLI
jgi:hypothetical protein